MKTLKSAVITGICGMALSASAVQAATLFSQPFDSSGNVRASQNDTTGGNGNFATSYDDFSFATAGTVVDVSWVGGYFNPPAQGAITGWNISIWADNAGQPGVLLNTTAIAGTANETSLGNYGGNPFFSFSGSLGTAFAAAAGTTYWLSVVPDLGFPPQWGWGVGTGGNGNSYQDFFGTRTQLIEDFAFTLSGTTAVPEPSQAATGALMLMGIARCAMRRRRAK